MVGINYLNNSDSSGEICLNYYNDRGSFIKTEISDQLVGIRDRELTNVDNLVGLACGESKKDTVLAAIKTKTINSLIIDESIATYLLNDIKK